MPCAYSFIYLDGRSCFMLHVMTFSYLEKYIQALRLNHGYNIISLNHANPLSLLLSAEQKGSRAPAVGHRPVEVENMRMQLSLLQRPCDLGP